MTFNNSILAGTTLVREAISSEGYTPGVNGWAIERDGNAEFNDVTVRADLQSDNFVTEVSGWNLERAGDAEFNDVTVRGEFNSKGNNPGTVRIANDSIFNALSRPSIEVVPNALALHGASAGNNDFAVVSINAGEVAIVNGLAATGIIVGANHFLHRGDTFTEPYTLETWVNMTVNSGTAVVGNEPQSKLLPDGTVICRGAHTGHSVVANALLATLPVAHSPLRLQRFMAAVEGTGTENILYVETDGQIRVARGSSNSSWYSNLRFSVI